MGVILSKEGIENRNIDRIVPILNPYNKFAVDIYSGSIIWIKSIEKSTMLSDEINKIPKEEQEKTFSIARNKAYIAIDNLNIEKLFEGTYIQDSFNEGYNDLYNRYNILLENKDNLDQLAQSELDSIVRVGLENMKNLIENKSGDNIINEQLMILYYKINQLEGNFPENTNDNTLYKTCEYCTPPFTSCIEPPYICVNKKRKSIIQSIKTYYIIKNINNKINS